MRRSNETNNTAVFWTLLLIGIAIRVAFLPIISLDMKVFLVPWYDHMAIRGAWASLGDEFSNYTPPYLYLLSLATFTNSFLSSVYAIKLISISFDFINAYLIYRIVKLHTSKDNLPQIAGVLFLCLPTIAMNSAAWGQADSIFTCFVIVCVYYLLQDKPLPAIVAFGIALAFKAQAIFISPFLLLLTLKKRLPWHYYLLAPVIYLAMMTPALVAGRSLASVFSVYLEQAETYGSLSMKAPNLYLFILDTVYTPVLYAGLVISFFVALAWALDYASKIKEMNREIMILCVTVSAAMMPFLLPKMHERYFYLMDVFTFILAFFIPRLWIPAVGSQVVSGLTYYVFLFISTQSPPPPIGAAYLMLAAAINTWLFGYLFWKQYKYIASQRENEGQPYPL